VHAAASVMSDTPAASSRRRASCGRLASQLRISQSAARRKVDIKASQDGIKDLAARIALAESMLAEALAAGVDNGSLFTDQLGAVGNDENFMTED
jgi:hypothetical protein